MDQPNKGVPLHYLAAQKREFVYFHCKHCKRCIAKTPAELMAIAPPETGLQSLTERLKCTDCGTKSFFFRVGSPVLDLTVGNVAKKRRHAE